MRLTFYCDGASENYCVYSAPADVFMVAESKGHTHNYNEYAAIRRALRLSEYACTYGLNPDEITIISDSQLAIYQLNTLLLKNSLPYFLPKGARLYELHSSALKPIATECLERIKRISPTPHLLWVPREKNLAGVHLEKLKKEQHRDCRRKQEAVNHSTEEPGKINQVLCPSAQSTETPTA